MRLKRANIRRSSRTAELIQVMSAAACALCHSAPLIRIRGTLVRRRRGNAIFRALISSLAGIKASYAHYSFVAHARVSNAEHVRPRRPISATASASNKTERERTTCPIMQMRSVCLDLLLVDRRTHLAPREISFFPLLAVFYNEHYVNNGSVLS